jgi:hypothetical protein
MELQQYLKGEAKGPSLAYTHLRTASSHAFQLHPSSDHDWAANNHILFTLYLYQFIHSYICIYVFVYMDTSSLTKVHEQICQHKHWRYQLYFVFDP